MSRIARAATHLAAVVAGEATLFWSRGPIPDPDLASPIADADAQLACLALVRALAAAAGAVVISCAVVGAVAAALGMTRLAAIAHIGTLPSLRTVASRAAGTGLAVTLALGPTAVAAAEPTPPTSSTTRPTPVAAPAPRMSRLPDAGSGPRMRRMPDAPPDDNPAAEVPPPESSEHPPTPPPPAHASPPATSQPTTAHDPDQTIDPVPEAADPAPEDNGDDPATRHHPSSPQPAQSNPTSPQSATAPAVEPGSVVVGPGDSFWRIAHREATARLGRKATDRETGALWVRLVDLNTDRLPVAGQPDLLFVGITLRMPSAP